MQQSNQSTEENQSTTGDFRSNREARGQPSGSGHTANNFVVYPLSPHEGCLVLPTALLTSESVPPDT